MVGEQFRKYRLEVSAYCLMLNHVHLILTPKEADGMSRGLGEAHRRYTDFVNARGRWTGHLFQSGYASLAMDDLHQKAAVSYISLNPVRAKRVSRAEEWAWSSVRAHLAGKDGGFVSVTAVRDPWPAFRELLLDDYEEEFTLRAAEGIRAPARDSGL